jgi:hypothetical protein
MKLGRATKPKCKPSSFCAKTYQTLLVGRVTIFHPTLTNNQPTTTHMNTNTVTLIENPQAAAQLANQWILVITAICGAVLSALVHLYQIVAKAGGYRQLWRNFQGDASQAPKTVQEASKVVTAAIILLALCGSATAQTNAMPQFSAPAILQKPTASWLDGSSARVAIGYETKFKQLCALGQLQYQVLGHAYLGAGALVDKSGKIGGVGTIGLDDSFNPKWATWLHIGIGSGIFTTYDTRAHGAGFGAEQFGELLFKLPGTATLGIGGGILESSQRGAVPHAGISISF